MNRRMLLVLALAFAFVVPAVADDDKADEGKIKEKIVGMWKLIEGERGGQPPPEDFIKGFKLNIKKDGKFVVHIGEQEMDGEYTLNLKGKIWEIDFKMAEGTRKGIFKFDGEKMKAAIGEPEADRPKDFASKDGSTDYYFVFERQKADKEKDK